MVDGFASATIERRLQRLDGAQDNTIYFRKGSIVNFTIATQSEL